MSFGRFGVSTAIVSTGEVVESLGWDDVSAAIARTLKDAAELIEPFRNVRRSRKGGAKTLSSVTVSPCQPWIVVPFEACKYNLGCRVTHLRLCHRRHFSFAAGTENFQTSNKWTMHEKPVEASE